MASYINYCSVENLQTQAMSVVNDRLDAAFTVLAGRLNRANRITEFA
jgi:hypothetical protein